MLAEFQKAMEYTYIGLKNTFGFLDDTFIVSKGSEDDHSKLVTECLKKPDSDNLFVLIYQNAISLHDFCQG